MELRNAIITPHAAEQMQRRQVGETEVQAVLAAPEAVWPVREGRVVIHGMMGNYLLRVFVDVDRSPPEVVTVYRTSKLDKYRKRP